MYDDAAAAATATTTTMTHTHDNQVRKAVTAGYFTNAAKKDPTEGYKTMVEGNPVYIHPSSALFNKNPEWLLYHEARITMMRMICYHSECGGDQSDESDESDSDDDDDESHRGSPWTVRKRQQCVARVA